MHEVTTVEGRTPTSKGTDSILSSTAAIEATSKKAAGDQEDGDSGALIGGVITGILLFVLFNVAITIVWGRAKRRRAKSKSKQENYSSARDSDDLYDDTALAPDGRLRPPNQGPPWCNDNATFYQINDEEYAEIGGRTPGAKIIYSLKLPTPDSRSVSSGERTPVYHILERDGPQSPLYHVLESELSNRLDKKAAGNEIYTSLQPTGSGTQTPIYQSLDADNTSRPTSPTLATEYKYKLENIAKDTVPDIKIVGGAPNQEYSLESNEQGPKEAHGNHREMPQISVDDAGVDSCDSYPISYDYVCDIEAARATVKCQSDFRPLDNGDVYLQLVADDQVCQDNVSQDSYDYVQDVEKMQNSGKSGQGEIESVSGDQNSNTRHEDGNLETNNNYLELVEGVEHTNDGYLPPKASNQNKEDDHNSAEYDYTYM